MNMNKVAIIGVGQVGMATAQMLAREQYCDEIVLVGRNKRVAQGVALDLQHAIPLYQSDVNIIGDDDFSSIEGADIVVITSGLMRQAGMSRLDLTESNLKIIDPILEEIIRFAPDSYLIMVTNPVDVLTYFAWKKTGWSKNRIIGLSCVLDASRMSSMISKLTGFSVKAISSLVIGGHGDYMLPLPRFSGINGIPIDVFLTDNEIDEVVEETRNAGSQIVNMKGVSGYIAAAASINSMISAILNNRSHLLPCVAVLDNEYQLKNIALGVPTVIGGNGVSKIIELPLNESEHAALMISANEVHEKISQLQFHR